MSRIGKQPIPVPAGVTVAIEPERVTVNGPKGELSERIQRAMNVEQKPREDGSDGDQILVTRPSDRGDHRALHGLTRTLIANMVEGVTKGFSKNLELVGVGYKAEKRPYGLQLSLGYSHPIEYRAPQGITLNAPVPTQIVVEGANKEVVGQVAAEIRSLRPPEPYKGKGVKYAGEQIRRKAGKAGGK
jgi:large subunit ribosomal protein L6